MFMGLNSKNPERKKRSRPTKNRPRQNRSNQLLTVKVGYVQWG